MRKFYELGVIVFLALIGAIIFAVTRPSGETQWGATFSVKYAEELGLDSRQTYTQLLNDFQLSTVRIPVYWDRAQPLPDTLALDEIEWMLNDAAARDVLVVLVIGQKVPRWPECHIPSWTEALPAEDYARALLAFETYVVDRFKNHPALRMWQVENEPLFAFGDCPTPDVALLQQEIAAVRAVDPVHPILLTVSGEQELWTTLSQPADVLGTSVYRTVWQEPGVTLTFPHPPTWYRAQAKLIQSSVEAVLISELQAEPWQNNTGFTAKDLVDHVAFARQTGIGEAWLWGVEWWYAMRQDGDGSVWEAAREIINQ